PIILVLFLARRVRSLGWHRGLRVWQTPEDDHAIRIDFYQRLIKLLEKQGITRELYQTPLEFASAVGISEARAITNAYNRVRFGDEKLSGPERAQIESLLAQLEQHRRKN